MNPVLLVVLAYVVGATPTSYWVGKAVYGVDLRARGSGNLGATNTYRVLGWKAALPVAAVDVAKGWLPVWLFPRLDSSSAWAWALAYATAVILGHVFSFWVSFRGGKGVATSAGVFLALAPWAVLGGLGVWLATVLATRIVSVASMASALALPVLVAFTPQEGGPALLGFTAALALFVVWAHRNNLRRLARGEEPRFGKGRGESAPAVGDSRPDDRRGSP